MAHEKSFKRQVWQAGTLTVALVACLIFGVIVLVGSDWIPGGLIVTASAIGLFHEVPVVRRLCSTGYLPSPPAHR